MYSINTIFHSQILKYLRKFRFSSRNMQMKYIQINDANTFWSKNHISFFSNRIFYAIPNLMVALAHVIMSKAPQVKHLPISCHAFYAYQQFDLTRRNNNPTHIPNRLIVKRIQVETDDMWFGANDVNQFRYKNSIQYTKRFDSLDEIGLIRNSDARRQNDSDKVNLSKNVIVLKFYLQSQLKLKLETNKLSVVVQWCRQQCRIEYDGVSWESLAE